MTEEHTIELGEFDEDGGDLDLPEALMYLREGEEDDYLKIMKGPGGIRVVAVYPAKPSGIDLDNGKTEVNGVKL